MTPWKQDLDFLKFMARMEYIVMNPKGDIEEIYVSGGVILYMWEAWKARGQMFADLPDTVEEPIVNTGASDDD